MARLLLDVSNQNNWRLLFNGEFRATQISERERELISPLILPIAAESRILIAKTINQPAKVTWKNGGTLTPLVDCGLAEFQNTGIGNYRLPCNGSKLLILPKFSSTYKLQFSCPYWFEVVTLTLHEYIGDERDSTEELIQELKTQINLVL